jgi:adenylate kinase
LLRSEKAAITGQAVSSEALRTDAVLDNQSLLIKAFARVLSSATEPVVFDGHCVVDTGAGLVEIPTEVIEALSISGIVYIQDSPAAIVARRAGDTTRTRPARSENEIALHQNHAVGACTKYASQLQISLHFVTAGDEPGFRAAVVAVLDG